MPCVTLLVTGVPRNALLENLSRNLDLLFDTDEIGTFKLRNLPNHPRTNKRQVALDFRSGFDAMAAQAKLDTYEYEYNGEMYTLYAKVNKVKEYMRSGFSPERNVEDENWRWSDFRTIPDVCYDDNMYRATHSKLNAHLALLRKQKLILEAERELLREKRKLKREYGSRGESTDGHDSEYEATTSKHRRQGSRERRSGSRRRRSQSREGHVVRGSKERRTRSRDRSRPRHAWEDRTRQLRSRSKERRSQSHETHDRDRSMSRELRDLRSLILSKRARSKSRERSKSVERVHPKTDRPYREPRSISRERFYRQRRSQSYERDYRDQIVSRERDRERRSMSKESDYGCYIHSRKRFHKNRRSTSPSRYTERRSKERVVQRSRSRYRRSESRNRTHVDDVIVLSRSRDYRVQRSRTPYCRHRHTLAIMRNPERSMAPREWSLDAQGDANEPAMINVTIFENEDGIKNVNYSPTVKNKQIANIPKKNSIDSDGINEMKENGTMGNTKNQKENQEKNKLAKFNSKIRKAQLLELKIESVSQNVKLLVLETLYELILESKVIISESNMTLLEKTLAELVRERVEPLVRLRNDCDIGVVLHKYKLQYSKENDVLLIRKMLEDISKTNESPAATNTIIEADKTSSDVAGQSTEIQDCSMQGSITGVNKENELQEDACSLNPTTTEGKESSEKRKKCDAIIPKEHAKNNDVNADNSKCKNIENASQIKGDISETNGPSIIIDIDSPDKPVPQHPKFYLVIKTLVKDMKRVIVNNNLTQLIQISDLKYVLRHTLRDLLKGQGYLPSKEIKNKFRALHPKEKDDQFIKNVINDIKDGKYPVLTDPPATNDCEDDVILIETKYDVVTVEDSDDGDDDVTFTGEQEATPQIQTHYLVDSSLEMNGTANLGTTNICPEKHELAEDNLRKLEPSKPGTATHVPVRSGSSNLGPSELRPNPSPCNPAQVNSSLSNFGATEVPTNPTASRWDLVNPCSINLVPNEPADNPTPGSIQPGSTVFIPAPGTSRLVTVNPDASKLRLVNKTNSSAVVNPAPGTSKLVTANPNASKLRSVNNKTNSSAVVSSAAGIFKLVTANSDTSKLRLVNNKTNSSAVVSPAPGTSRLVTVNPDTSKVRLVKKKTNSSAVVSPAPGTSRLVTVNPDTSKVRLVKKKTNSSAVVSPAPGTSRLVTVNPDTSKLRLVNNKTNSSAVVSTAPGTSKLVTANPNASKLRLVNNKANSSAVVSPAPGTSKLVTANPNASKLRLVNNKANSSAVVSPAPGTSKLVTANPNASKLRLVNSKANSSAVVSSAPGTSKLVKANPDASKLRLVYNKANSSAVVSSAPGTSKLVTANPDASKLRLANQVNLRTSNLRPNYVSPSNITVTQLRPTNPSTSRWDLIKPRSANFTPLGPNIVEIKTGSSNHAQVPSGPSNDTQVKLKPFNIAQVNPDPSNHDATELRPTNPRASRWDLVNPGSANLSATAFRPKTVSSNPLQVIPGLYDLEQVNLDPLNVARVNPEPTNSSTNFGPVSPGACNFLPACLRPTELRPALATSKIRPGLATGAVNSMSKDSQNTEKANTANIDKPCIMANTDKYKAKENHTKTVMDNTENANNSEDVKENIGENNSNSLKVTAITIVTSLNELAAITDKTADGPTMEVPIENIKDEIPFENSDTELTDTPLMLAPNQSSLVTSITDKAYSENAEHNGNKAIEGSEDNSSNSLKVTAITIVTSLNELTKISDKTTNTSEMEVPIEDIKEEIPFEKPEETDPTLSLDRLTSLTEKGNTKNVEDDRNKATERVEKRNNNSLKVTAITIMTSLTELAAIADGTGRSKIELPVEDIKEEIETENSETEQIDSTSKPASSHKSKELNGVKSYDKGKAVPKTTEGSNNDQIDSRFGEGIGQENSNYSELTSNEKRSSHDKTASGEEDETIESILKYIQSLM